MQDYQKRLVLNLLAYGVQRNLSPERLCELSGLRQTDLLTEAGPKLTQKQIGDIWMNAIHLSDDQLFGLHFGESLQMAALGVVGELIQHSQTIGEALTYAGSFAHLITDLFEIDVIRFEKTFVIRLIIGQSRQTEEALALLQMMNFFMAFLLHEVDGLVLEKIRPLEVKLLFEETNRSEYERVLRCANLQNVNDFILEFDNRYWDEPILTANYELQRVLLQTVNALTGTSQRAQSFSERITNFLLTNAYLGLPALRAVAANFNVSGRSLQRKLQEEGVTYQQLVDSVRKSLALNYLASGQYPVKEVSYMLGYIIV